MPTSQRLRSRERVLSVAVFAGAVVLGASLAARATVPCEGADTELRVVHVTKNGADEPVPGLDEGYSVYAYEQDDETDGYTGFLYDPATGTSRQLSLEPVSP